MTMKITRINGSKDEHVYFEVLCFEHKKIKFTITPHPHGVQIQKNGNRNMSINPTAKNVIVIR